MQAEKMCTLLRWSVWGPLVLETIPMLRDSILSFRKYFGPGAEYIVFTDRPHVVGPELATLATVMPYESAPLCSYDWEGVTPWRKWAPTARWAPGRPEILIDSDVFCVGVPTELLNFCAAKGDAVCTLRETMPEWWCYGAFRAALEPTLPKINAGLVAQQSDANIHADLEALYRRWRSSVSSEQRTQHDEQGAIAVILREAERNGRAVALPLHRYLLLSPRSNAHIKSLDGLAMIHATYPDHPYYHLFRDIIRSANERT